MIATLLTVAAFAAGFFIGTIVGGCLSTFLLVRELMAEQQPRPVQTSARIPSATDVGSSRAQRMH